MEKLTNFFKLISDETRLRIMVLLYHNEFCVCQLCGITGISQPNMSKHLGKLRDMGLVKDNKKEQYTFYSTNIEEKVFHQILEDIVSHVDEYPIFKTDLEKSKAAAKYIEIVNRNKKIEE